MVGPVFEGKGDRMVDQGKEMAASILAVSDEKSYQYCGYFGYDLAV